MDIGIGGPKTCTKALVFQTTLLHKADDTVQRCYMQKEQHA